MLESSYSLLESARSSSHAPVMCPPPPSTISPFAVLAFLLISVNTAMNIINAVNNNNNNRNNNNDNNNNNNMFNQNNVNMNMGRSLSNSSWLLHSEEDASAWLLLSSSDSDPWDPAVFRALGAGGRRPALDVAQKWLGMAVTADPACALRITCDLARNTFGMFQEWSPENDYCSSVRCKLYP